MNDVSKNRVSIQIVAGPLAGRELDVETYDTFVLGRASDCQISIPDDRFLSRYHLRLEIRPPLCQLIDLESRNGTQVNGVTVSSAALVEGDTISVGDTQLVIASVDAASLDPAPPSESGKGDETVHLSEPQVTMVALQNVRPIPGYEVSECLGQGAMGSVYKARQKGTDQTVALKIISPHSNDYLDPKAQQMFIREASILGKLNHRRIVEFLELGMQDSQFYIAMEYVDTFDLASELMATPLKSRCRIASGVVCYILDALAYAHKNNVVHRDIKPTNILAFRRDGKVRAKLTDFGLAKNFLTAGFSDITQENQAKGTLAYIAPEQLINCREATPSCDIYSTGACLYHYVSGRLPHAKEGSDRLLASAILNDDPVPLINREPTIPHEFNDVVMKAMARDPVQRYQSANALRQALLPFIKKVHLH